MKARLKLVNEDGRITILAQVDNKVFKVGYKFYDSIIEQLGEENVTGHLVDGYIEHVPINPKKDTSCMIVNIRIINKYKLKSRVVTLDRISDKYYFFVHPDVKENIKCKREDFVNIETDDRRAEFRLFPKGYQI